MARDQDVEAYRQTYLQDKSELSGRSESEHIGGPVTVNNRRPNLRLKGEGRMFNRYCIYA